MLVGYKGFDRAGNPRSGQMEAASLQAAEERLWEADVLVTRVWRLRRLPPLYEAVPTLFGVKRKHLIQLTEQLCSLLNSGITLSRALNLLLSQVGHPALRETVSGVIRELSSGSSFSEAIRRNPAIFPSIYSRMVRVGEETGRLGELLGKVASTLRKEEETQGKLRGSLAYPAFVVVVSLASVFILVSVTIPLMAGLFAEFRADLPLMTRIVLASTGFMSDYGLRIVVGLMVLSVLGWVYVRTPRGAARRDYLLFRLPLVGRIVRNGHVAVVSDNLAIMVGAGVPLLEALRLVMETSGNRLVRDTLGGVIADLQGGESLSGALGRHPLLFPMLVVEAVRIAEESGNLDERLAAVAVTYQEEADRAVKQVVGVVEPALIVFVGLLVGLIGVTVISTVYAVLPSIR